MTRISTLVGLVALLLSSLPTQALAQGDPKAKPVDLPSMLRTAYSLRRRGQFRAAAAAYEQVLSKLGKDDKAVKRVLAREAAELFVVMGAPKKAVQLYRRNNDVANEIDVLLNMDDPQAYSDALRVSQFVDYPKGQGLALARQGKVDEALALMKAKGLDRERADLLFQQERYAEAAPLYEQLQEFFEYAQCLRLAGQKRPSERAYEDAIAQLRFRLRDPNGNLKRVKAINKLYKDAPDGVTAERARLALARAYGRLGADYRRMAEAYGLSGRDEYRKKAPLFAANALKFLGKQKDLLEDLGGGGDAYGKALAAKLDVAGTISKVEAESRSYQ